MNPSKQELTASLVWTLTVNRDEKMINSIFVEGLQQYVLIEEMWGLGYKGKEEVKEPLRVTCGRAVS